MALLPEQIPPGPQGPQTIHDKCDRIECPMMESEAMVTFDFKRIIAVNFGPEFTVAIW